MNSGQLALDFAPAAATRAESLQARLKALLAVLRERGDWTTRRELEALGFEERELRELGEIDEDGRIFSYPGSPGYKLFDLVVEAEFDRCISLKSQGEKMVGKYVRFQARWHRRHKPESAA